MRLILVRHGSTIWNAEGKYQGTMDVPLSDKGRQEAQMVAERLRDEDITAIYSSDLVRARETAEIIARPHGLPVKVIPEFGEINFGDWEGLTAQEIREKFGEEVYRTWLEDPINADISGGDRITDFAERVVKGFNQVIEAHPDDTVVLATHGGALMALGCHLHGEDLNCFRKYYHHNAAISVVEVEGDVCRFVHLNYQEHLQKEKQ
ncbi:MAG: histidine phosphatase family protein [Syntrophomonadales bacterium]